MTKTARNAVKRGRKSELGIAMVEMMIAAVVLSVSIFGLMSAISSTVMVDAVTQENNLALDAARQVIEQVKSEHFSDIEDKINYVIPTFSDASGGNTTSMTGEDGEGAEVVQDPYAEGMIYNPFSAEGNYSTENPTYDWYGEVMPEGDELYTQDSIVIDEFGNFEVTDPLMGTLSPQQVWGTDVPVGIVRVSYARDAGGNLVDDILDITVLIRWSGQRGDTSKVVRCQVGDWGGY